MERVSAERAALVLIGNDRLPCRTCGEPHEYRQACTQNHMMTWAHPDDGHAYRQVSAAEFARQVLAETHEEDD